MMLRAVLLANVALLAFAEDPKTLEEYKEEKANASAAADAAGAKDAKMAAVGKVATMLEDVQAKLIEEGEEEAKTYNKFACFCKDTIAEKTSAIKANEDEKADLEANIDELSKKRGELDTKIKELDEDIEQANEEVTGAKDHREKELTLYKANLADVEAGLTGLEGAIKVLKSSKKPSLLQLKGTRNVDSLRHSLFIADALGLTKDATSSAVSAFLQQEPEVEFEDYKFHSNDVISTLEKLQKSFLSTKEELEKTEVEQLQGHNMYLQSMDAKIKAYEKDLEDSKASKADTIASIKSASEQLTTVSAELLDNQQYLEKLAQMCKDKKKTWDQRVRVRSDELFTLTKVIDIIKGAVSNKTQASTVRFAQVGISLRRAKALATDRRAMDVVEAEAEEVESFLQEREVQHHRHFDADAGREYVASMLRKAGGKINSKALTSLAQQLFVVDGADPFAKIKVLIQELIERLLQEAANEANQKGWCDKATAAAEQKKTYSAEAIMKVNAEMAELEALRDKLTEELGVLETEIAELNDARAKAEEIRAKEKAENEFAIAEAKAGLEAVSMAKNIMDEFYKTAAKETVSLSQQGPEEDAPDAGFDNFEAYTGAQGEATGIVGMMEVIASDFTRTITETSKEEAAAEDEHLEFMTETGKSLGEKTVVRDQKTTEKDNAEDDLEQADQKLQSKSKTLQTAITELIELKKACVDTGMSYEERVARREQEIEALKKALCILKAYAEYGPDGLGDAC